MAEAGSAKVRRYWVCQDGEAAPHPDASEVFPSLEAALAAIDAEHASLSASDVADSGRSCGDRPL